MKKWKGVLAIMLSAGCLSGCGQFKAERNTVKIQKDGSIQAAVIDTLDKAYYSRTELEKTVDDAVAEYNQSAGEDTILVKKFGGTEEEIQLYMDYKKAEDYQKFNHVTFYAGDLQGAYDNDYEFPDEFQVVEKGKITGSVSRSEILSGLNYSVLIYSEEMDAEVPGKILYISKDAALIGKKKATNILDEQAETTQAEKSSEVSKETEAEKGQFELGSDDAKDESETDESTEETKHELTFVIYQ